MPMPYTRHMIHERDQVDTFMSCHVSHKHSSNEQHLVQSAVVGIGPRLCFAGSLTRDTFRL